MSQPDGMLEVSFSSLDNSMFSIRYAPSHLQCPRGCVPTLWVAWTQVKEVNGLWEASSRCYSCSTAWGWTMNPDKPLEASSIVLRPLGDASDKNRKGDTEPTDND
jgi:hypothetical protein